MAAPLRPTSTKTYGRENWKFLPAIASQAAPTLTEINAATGLDITLVAFGSGTGWPTQETNRVTREKRFGDTRVFEQIGDTNTTGGDMVYAFDPQSAANSDGRKFYGMIPEGTKGFLVRRQGIDQATDFAASQKVDVYPVEFGPSQPTNVGEGETSEAAAKCAFAVTGPPSYNVAVAA